MSTTIAQNAFLPTQVPGIQLWLDAADTSPASMTLSGTTVTSWKDKSGNGNNATPNTTIVLAPNALGPNLPGMTFTNTQWFLGNISITGATMTVFGVFTMDSSSTAACRLISLGAPNTNDYNNAAYVGILRINTNIMGPDRNGNYTSVAFPYSTPTLVTTWYDGSTANVTANGTINPTSLASSGNFGISSYAISANTNTSDGNGPLSGFISEIIVYNTTLTTSQRQQVEGYLAQKWGLQTSLPPNHPYRYSAYFTNQAYISTNISPMITNRFTNASFNPANIAACLLWLDGADPAGTGVIPANGSTLTTWKDKSPTGNNMTVTSGTLTYTTNPYSVSFPNTQVTCTSALSTNVVTAGSSCIFIVVRDTYINPTTFGYAFTCVNINDYSLRFEDSPTNLRVSPTGDIGANYYVNGTLASPGGLYGNIITVPAGYNVIDGTFTVSGTTQFGLSQPNGGNRYFTGNIQEVILYSGPITTAQQQQVEGYLAWKWGLNASLPATHPYKKTSAVFVTQPSTLAALAANPYNNMTVYGTFNPKNTSGIALWLDGKDTSSASMTLSGKTVTTWKDKSGGSYNASGVNSPQLLSSGGVSFNGSQYFTLSAPYSQTSSVFMVATGQNSTSVAGGQYYWNFNNTNQGGNIINNNSFFPTSPLFYYDNVNSSSGAFVTGNTLVNPFLVSAVQKPGTSIFGYYNGSQAFTNSYTAGTATAVSVIGAAINNGASPINANIYEIIFYNAALTTNQRQQVEGYLAWKWGLQGSLPSTHAYKSFPPPP